MDTINEILRHGIYTGGALILGAICGYELLRRAGALKKEWKDILYRKWVGGGR